MDWWLKRLSIKRKPYETSDTIGKVQRLDARGSAKVRTASNLATAVGRCNSAAAMSESKDLRSDEDPQRCENWHEHGKSSAKVKQKYHTDFIKFGFFGKGMRRIPSHNEPHLLTFAQKCSYSPHKMRKITTGFMTLAHQPILSIILN